MTDLKTRAARAPRRNARLGRLPNHVWICAGVMLLAQMIAYYGTRLLLGHAPLHDLATPLDQRIPFIPAWVTVYFLAYLSWVVSAAWILLDSRGEPARAYRFSGAYALAMFLSALVFLIYPGTIERPEVVGDGFFPDWVRLLYRIDSPTNLCPSLHVLASYFCWRGTLDCRRIPRWYRWFNFAFLILVCLSILFVKQHAVVDIFAAIVIGELALQAAGRCRLERVFLAEDPKQRKKNGGGHLHGN